MNAWNEMPLEAVLDALIDYRGKSPKKSETGIPVISAKVVKAGRILSNIEQKISHDYYQEWMRRGYPAIGDVVMTTEGPLGEIARLDEKTVGYALGQRIVTMRGKVGVLDNGYLKYLLMSPLIQDRLESRATGTTVLGISQRSLRQMPIPLAPIRQQREIAAILGALDDKIELNRNMTATLEEMARALYRSWFVDFDPAHAKAAGRAPTHMAPQTADLFPDSFGDDGLPEGWKVGALSDLMDFNPREKLPKGTLAPYLDMKALPTAGMSAEPPYDRAFTSGTKFRARDTLLARITPCLENGKTAMVDDLGAAEIGWGSTEFIVMRAKGSTPSSLPYCVARDASFREEAIASMTGSSGRQRADAKTIAAIETAVPPEEIIVAFGQATMPMIEKAHQLGSENQTLATLRDTLLPRLMSGELRVGEATELVMEYAE